MKRLFLKTLLFFILYTNINFKIKKNKIKEKSIKHLKYKQKTKLENNDDLKKEGFLKDWKKVKK